MHETVKPLADRVSRLEAESRIRSTLSEYMYICDRLDGDTDLNALGNLFSKNAVWRGRGDRYAKDFGEYKGRKAIIDWLGTFCTTPPHFEINAHFVSSERIDILSENTAQGRWLMLQTPTFHDGSSLLMAAELQVAFAIESGVWRISVFETTNLYTRAVGDWSQDASVPAPRAMT